MKKIFSIILMLFLATGTAIAINETQTDEEKIIELNTNYNNKLSTIDCNQPQVNIYSTSKWECDINGICIKNYKFNITGIDFQLIDLLDHTLKLHYEDIGTKTEETLIKDFKKQKETEAKEYCKFYKEGLKTEYTFEK